MQKLIRFFIIFMIATGALSFIKPKEKINWISIAELNELYYKNPKPIVLDVYTNWCGWCKEMERTTYRNKKLADYVNEHYYAVKLNAESNENLIFNGKKYKYSTASKSNELAEFLLFGRMEYPTTVFLSTIDAQPAPLAGYMKPKQMEAPLKYFGDGAYLTQTFVAFNKNMKKEW